VTAYHRVSRDRFAALASGLGGPETVIDLAAAQSSKRRLMLRHLLGTASGEAVAAAAETLIRADQHDSRVTADLTSDPLVGTWIMRTVRQATDGLRPDRDLAQLGALAAAAALRTGQDARLTAWAIDGRLTLPTMGTAVVGSDGPVVIEVTAGSATVSGANGSVRLADDDPAWRPLRRLRARDDGLVAMLVVEDGSPYRNCYHAPPTDRLGDDEARRWQELFSEAWSLLVRYLPQRAAELSAGLRSVIPLAAQEGDMDRSGTSRDAFGAVGMTTPRSATDFAVTLVHEFQHSKLSGLLDLVPMVVGEGKERHFAPWRVDPRPTTGLLQGSYAFLGIADTWRGLRAAPDLQEQATRDFAMIRSQVDVGVTALEGSTELTDRGKVFVAGMRVVADRLLAEHVPASVEEHAAEVLEKCQRAWILRNGESAR
jgi:uncharacterized protein